ncbi:hypothetical protein EMCRGX_G021772 [Ephydatia muelleri]
MCPALTDRHCAALSAKAHSGSDVITTACKGQNYEEELDFVCNFFTNDFNKIELAAELLTLRTFYGTEVAADEKPSVNSIKTALLALSTMQRKLLGAVVRLFQLLVTLPATNATSERSFSALHMALLVASSVIKEEFVNHLNEELFHLTKIHHKISSAYHPQTNGLVERKAILPIENEICPHDSDEAFEEGQTEVVITNLSQDPRLWPPNSCLPAFLVKIPALLGKILAFLGKIPAFLVKIPTFLGKIPTFLGKIPAFLGKIPTFLGKILAFLGKIPAFLGKILG